MEERAFNRLIHSKSPYLLQHAHNPVDWYPWGEEAFHQAEKEGKPVFLSIGYSTCHWCHVMAHESFEDGEVADFLNKHFISIKVDREERPDIDQIYMSACQLLNQRGGWPLSVFMTPRGKPFFVGTYFPKTSRMGIPGFINILRQLIMAWENDRQRIENSCDIITDALQPSSVPQNNHTPLDIRPLKLCFDQLSDTFDSTWGGFSVAPKFPLPHNLTFLLRWFKRSGDRLALHMVEKTLIEMRKGGIFDQIGWGFHRYSVDEKWFIPHFEKMLYDQALLALAYLDAFQLTRKNNFKQTAEEVLTYVLRDLTSPDGGFYSAEDADSEGKEGEFYVWTMEEIKKHLPRDLGDLFCRFYGITESGNFEPGRNIPHITIDPEVFAEQEGMSVEELMKNIHHARTVLFDVREKRVHPLKDDKIITSWNGLMIAAFARAYQVLGDPAYVAAAQKAAHFILDRLRTIKGKLLRRFRDNDAAYPGYVEDYAFVVWGLIELYEATFELDYLEEAVNINEVMVDLFWDANEGGLFYTEKDNEPLIAPIKDVHDGALPSGNSVASLNMVRLSRMTGNVELEKKADHLLKTFSLHVFSNPLIATQFLQALDFALGPTQEIVIAGDRHHATTQKMIAEIRSRFLPNTILLLASEGAYGERVKNLSPFTAPLIPCKQEPTVYVCDHFTCKKPVTEVEELMSFFTPSGDIR